MVFITRFLRVLLLLVVTIGYCFSSSTKVVLRGETDIKKYMGYNYKIEVTSDNYCVSSTSPKDGILNPGTGVVFTIDYKSGAFSYCGWRHSSQLFHVQKYDDPNIAASFQWYKPVGTGKSAHINVKDDPHGIVHVNSEHSIYIGYPRK